MGGLKLAKETCTVITTQDKGSNPRHYLSRELTAIWLLQPKYTESLLLVWQTKMRLFIYEYDFLHRMSLAASTAKSLP